MSESASQPLRHTNLRDQALEVIRQALVSGEIKPGEIYSAAALATRLGVSGSPVREAMLTLVNQGLMEPVRNRGYRVVPMSEHDLDEVYEMRLLLEVHGTLQAAGNMSKGDLARLESTVADMEAAAAKVTWCKSSKPTGSSISASSRTAATNASSTQWRPCATKPGSTGWSIWPSTAHSPTSSTNTETS